MKRSLAVLALMVALVPAQAPAQSLRIFFGDSLHPVVRGEVWLVANRWGAYPAVLVATIRDGVSEQHSVPFPKYWEQAEDYKLVIGVSEQVVPASNSPVVDRVYTSLETSEFLTQFPTLYVSPPIPKEANGPNWPAALDSMGRMDAAGVVLPRPTRRTVRLLSPDGKPLVNARVRVLLYGSDRNHCGVAVGLPVGVFMTDSQGEISFVATGAPLAVGTPHYEEEQGGPAGVAFALGYDAITDAGQLITLKKWWTLPEYDYVLSLQTSGGKPIAAAHLTACLWHPGCGIDCGWLGRANAVSDGSGVLRFREPDLRSLRSITVVNSAGQERELSTDEMRELLTTYWLRFVWK